MTDLTLHYAVPSRGMTVHWMLEELGQPFQRRLLSLADNEHKTPEFLALNPMGRVPVLAHGDVVVTETAAIVAYLADAFPQANLGMPLDDPLRGPLLRWLFFAPVSAEPAIIWKRLGFADTEMDYQPFATVEDVAHTLAEAVRGRQYVVGDRFTAADVMIGSTIMWGTQMMPVLPALPELTAYWNGLAQRKAWITASERDRALMPA